MLPAQVLPHYSWGYEDLSKSHDQKPMMLLAPVESAYGLLSRSCFYCPNLIAVAPVTRVKEIFQSHVILM